MTYADAMQTARRIAHMPMQSIGEINAFTKAWADFEDTLLGKLSTVQARALVDRANSEQQEIMAAGVILAILEPTIK